MAGLQEYKCPCCGGAIAFDSTRQKMKCPYCDSEFEMEALASGAIRAMKGEEDVVVYTGIPVFENFDYLKN